MRSILHCDCNSFFASVEIRDNPSLGEGAMAVCGNPDNRHGIILAKNEEAKRFGVKTGETIWQAKKKCPSLRLEVPHFEKYEKCSQLINNIYLRYTDLVEPFGIDESWLDTTASTSLFGSGEIIADELRAVVKREAGISISVGVSFNKVFAKLGSDYKKPDATTVIDYQNYKSKIFPLPISDLLFVGRSTGRILARYGIRSIGDIAHADQKFLKRVLGKSGETLHRYANGFDESPVSPYGQGREIKSVGNGETFSRDIFSDEEIRNAIFLMSSKACERMRNHGLKCESVELTVKGSDFRSISHRAPLKVPTFNAKTLGDAAFEIYKSHHDWHLPVRSVTVTGIKLRDCTKEDAQLCFINDSLKQEERRSKMSLLADELNYKFGANTLRFGFELSDSPFVESKNNTCHFPNSLI